MKWSERTKFYKALLLTEILCLLVYATAVVCYICGVLPSVYGLPWAQATFGVFFLCNGIDYLKISRTVMVINFVTAGLAFSAALLAWLL